ncbi:arrestin, beta 2b isoform X2 [Hippocampus comes]|uniref:arrestin, beta 2b isoform X2 n=1 Tax=Hippocampus comes TaxID=109280 RepID=UPI00094EA925|nr:PREDICTED: beta-arrestin-2 isoform X2 [Hippocampus comes]
MGDKEATRVFKKSSPNGKLSVYLGKRDFVDHLDHVDAVDGVVLVDPEYLQDRKVFVSLACVFRYGREDVDVLGLSFRKDLYVSTFQAFPRVLDQKPLSSLQEKLLRKLGQDAHPFCFSVPQNLPCSVTLQPGPEDTGKACGVDFELQAYCARTAGERIHQRNSVHLVIRKVQYAPEKKGPQPTAESSRSFLMSERPLHLEASLDKELYYHGEPISVNVHVTNNSGKTVRKVKIAGSVQVSRGPAGGGRAGLRQFHLLPSVHADALHGCQSPEERPGVGWQTQTPRHQPGLQHHNEGRLRQGDGGHRRVLPRQSQTGGVSRRGHGSGASFCSDASQTQRPGTSRCTSRRRHGWRPRHFR